MIITFIGHSSVFLQNEIKEMVKEQIKANIINIESVTCYLGRNGDFDSICALACKELKKEFTGIEAVYVTPYLRISEQAKIQEMQRYDLCDTSIYPPIENTPPKFAISKRNEWMIANADLVIAYVKRNNGGAYKSLQFAKRRKKRIINICDLN